MLGLQLSGMVQACGAEHLAEGYQGLAVSRLILICLFLASGGCFAWFGYLQLTILAPVLP